ncbi:MAG: hypothetical protein F4231_00750 [Acidimicrobiaceae bacterium]|nr:hypothetical protein [Acidimicrobiaceae bacterium]
MDTAIASLRITFVVIVVVSVLFGVYLHQLAQITAGTAAAAAVAAAANALDNSNWDCTDSGPHWRTATEAAATAAVARTLGSSAATATDFSLTADPSCSVIATVTGSAAGARYWLHARAAACRPTRASFTAGLALPAPC